MSEDEDAVFPKRIAIVHDWLTSPGGAECVLAEMVFLFPDADIFTVCDFLEEKHRAFLGGRRPKTTFIQRLPFARRFYQSYLPLMPIAIEQLDLSAYEVIISSSYAVAKGVITGPEQLHISYIHTPIRYAWHLQSQYLRSGNLDRGIKSIFARLALHYLRAWDLRSAVGVDVFIGNSSYVCRQISKLYNREAILLYPPVSVSRLPFCETKEDFYMTASRLVPYKCIDLIVSAFAKMPGRRLIVVGDGTDRNKIENLARGHANIEILGYQSRSELDRLMSKARAFVFAAIEDFGIVPVEAQACGTPVIALGKGGALETVLGLDSETPTGVFFKEQTEASVIDAVQRFEREEYRISPAACRRNAERFSVKQFLEGFTVVAGITTSTMIDKTLSSSPLISGLIQLSSASD